MSFLRNDNWPKEDRIDENSLTEGNSSINGCSVEDLKLVKKDRMEENSLTKGNTSMNGCSVEDLKLVKKDRMEENSLTKGNTSMNGSSVEDLKLVRERTEESRLTEEIYSEESGLTGESKRDLNLEDWVEENSLTEEATSFTSEDQSSLEDLNFEEIDLREEGKNYFNKEHGLVFRKMNCFETERNLFVRIVIIGNEDCGKTELIKTVFECHPSFTVAARSAQIEYRVFLPGCHSHIWIYDAKKTEFVRKANFAQKTVFLFCYEADNPQSFAKIEETWIPAILEKSMKEMYYLLVSIKPEMKTKPREKKRKKEDLEMTMKIKATELNCQFRAGRIIESFIEDKHSLLNVFQFAIDYACPRFQFI